MNDVMKIYDFLYSSYGSQGWWPILELGKLNSQSGGSCYHPLDYSFPKTQEQVYEVCLGAILTQAVGWNSVEKALFNLDRLKLLDPKKVVKVNVNRLKEAIKPAGYYNEKAKKIIEFSNFFLSLDRSVPSRDELLSVWGVGKETADSMLLYAFKVPTFVIDSYTIRIFSHLGFLDKDVTYDEAKIFFERNIGKDLVVYQEYHALLVEHAKRFYRGGSNPKLCPLYNKVLGIKKH